MGECKKKDPVSFVSFVSFRFLLFEPFPHGFCAAFASIENYPQNRLSILHGIMYLNWYILSTFLIYPLLRHPYPAELFFKLFGLVLKFNMQGFQFREEGTDL